MALTVGTRLAHYDVTALIGEGGWRMTWKPGNTAEPVVMGLGTVVLRVDE